MAGILPEIINGAKAYRTQSGVPIVGAGVSNAYSPASQFTATCALTALPNDCTARLTPDQVNALVSEMLCLGEAFNPEGTWDCASLCNLSRLFKEWQDNTLGEFVTTDDLTAALVNYVSKDEVEAEVCDRLATASVIRSSSSASIAPDTIQITGAMNRIVIPGSTIFSAINLGADCPRTISARMTIGWYYRAPDPNDGIGYISTMAQISWNGGATWTDAVHGGGEQLFPVMALNRYEQEYIRFEASPPLTGIVTVGMRTRLAFNGLVGTTIRNSRTELYLTADTLSCC